MVFSNDSAPAMQFRAAVSGARQCVAYATACVGYATWETRVIAADHRLRKHADYQRVYAGSRKQFSKQMSYFFLLRPQQEEVLCADKRADEGIADYGAAGSAPRIGLTVGKAMGKAVERNRIKRRMREAVRRQRPLLAVPVDVVLHPRRSAIDCDFELLESEVAAVFRAIQRVAQQQAAKAAQASQ